MKQYPSIGRDIVDVPIIAFDKLDGSNIRCEYDPKKGLHKFGSRKVLLGEDHPMLGQAIGLVKTLEDPLGRIFRKERWPFVTLFFEFWGPQSFAGLHVSGDEMRVTLLDVDVYKHGMLLPREFVKLFDGNVPTPAVLYEGKANAGFVESVQTGALKGMTFEGVVCKGAPTKRGYPPTFFKIKSNEWIRKVKERYGSDPKILDDLL